MEDVRQKKKDQGGKVKPLKIAHRIRGYRAVVTAWYINQSSTAKCNQANRLERRLDRLIYDHHGPAHDRLVQMFLKAGWMATGHRHIAAR